MTVYTVGEGGDFRTLGAAVDAAKPGDVFNILSGIFNETLRVDVPDTTWQAAPGHAPVFDGGWNSQTLEKDGGALFAVKAPGVTIRNLRGRNSKGPGIAVSASDVTVQDCHVFNCYKHGLLINGPAGAKVRGVLVEDSSAIRVCQGMAVDRSNEAVGGTCSVVGAEDCIIRDCVFGDSFKEGFNIDRGTKRVIIANTIMFDTNHGACYFNCSQDNEVINCTFYHTLDERYRNRKNGNFPAGVVIGDERGGLAEGFPRQRGNRFTNNLVVGFGRFVEVRNNAKTSGGGYNTALDGHDVSGNTFIAGPETSEGISIEDNAYGREHVNSIVRDNVFEFAAARPNAVLSKFGGGGVAFDHNAWSAAPIARARGEGDVVGDLRLVNPAAVITKDPVTSETDFAVANYRPAAGSPLIGAASDGGVIGKLEPAGVEPPPPPPPPPPDDDDEPPDIEAIVNALAAAWGELGAGEERLAAGLDMITEGMTRVANGRAQLQALIDLLQE